MGKATYQLSYVFLNGVWINKHSDGNQGVEGEIKDLVTEERDDPGSALLISSVSGHGAYQDHEKRNCNRNAHV